MLSDVTTTLQLLQSVRVQVSDVAATLQLLQSVRVQAGGADCSCFPTALTATDLTCQICNVSSSIYTYVFVRVVFTSNRVFYSTSVHPVSVLILHPREIQIRVGPT